MFSLKKLMPVRLFKNDFFKKVNHLESNGAIAENLQNILGAGRPKKGIFDGDLIDGELENGQVCAQVKKIEPAKDILENIWQGYLKEYKKLTF